MIPENDHNAGLVVNTINEVSPISESFPRTKVLADLQDGLRFSHPGQTRHEIQMVVTRFEDDLFTIDASYSGYDATNVVEAASRSECAIYRRRIVPFRPGSTYFERWEQLLLSKNGPN